MGWPTWNLPQRSPSQRWTLVKELVSPADQRTSRRHVTAHEVTLSLGHVRITISCSPATKLMSLFLKQKAGEPDPVIQRTPVS